MYIYIYVYKNAREKNLPFEKFLYEISHVAIILNFLLSNWSFNLQLYIYTIAIKIFSFSLIRSNFISATMNRKQLRMQL